MCTIAFIREIDRQSYRRFREIEVVRTHHFQNRRPHKLQKSYKCRYRISWQTEHGTCIDLTEEKWFTRFDRDTPDVDFGAQGAECCLNQIVLSDRDAPRNNKDITFDSALDRFDQSFALVGAMFG